MTNSLVVSPFNPENTIKQVRETIDVCSRDAAQYKCVKDGKLVSDIYAMVLFFVLITLCASLLVMIFKELRS